MTPEEYNAIYEANKPWLEGVYREQGFDPRIAHLQYQRVGTLEEGAPPPNWVQVAHDHWVEQPHPREPSLKIGEFALAVRLATKAKFGGHASPQEAALFMREFKSMDPPISPEEFEHVMDRLAPESFTYHGRPPSMREIQRLRDADPGAVRNYFGGLPDKHFPSVPASEMVRYLEAATPLAKQHLGRNPVKYEANVLYHAKASPQGVADYYQGMAQSAAPSQDSTAKIGGDQGRAVQAESGRNP